MPSRLGSPPKLAHSVSQNLGVGVVDLGRLHRISGRDDLVAGGEDRDDRLSPDVDVFATPIAASTPVSRLVSSCPDEARSRPR